MVPPPRPPHGPRIPHASRPLSTPAAPPRPSGAAPRPCGHLGHRGARPHHRSSRRPGAAPGRRVYRRDRPALQRPVVLQDRVQPRQAPGQPALQGERGLPGRGRPRAHPQAGRRGLPDQSPLERRLRGGRVRPGVRRARELRSGRVGAGVAARVRVQVVRRLLRAATVPGAALSRRAGALRAAHYPERRDPGNLPRGRPDARRTTAIAEARLARLHPHYAERSHVHPRHLARPGRHQLRSGAGRPFPHPRAGRPGTPARAHRAARHRDRIHHAQPRAARHWPPQALRPRGGQLRPPRAPPAPGSPRRPRVCWRGPRSGASPSSNALPRKP